MVRKSRHTNRNTHKTLIKFPPLSVVINDRGAGTFFPWGLGVHMEKSFTKTKDLRAVCFQNHPSSSIGESHFKGGADPMGSFLSLEQGRFPPDFIRAFHINLINFNVPLGPFFQMRPSIRQPRLSGGLHFILVRVSSDKINFLIWSKINTQSVKQCGCSMVPFI